MKAIAEIRRVNGKPAHRFEGAPAGAFYVSNSEIDAIIDHVSRELGATRKVIFEAIEVDNSSISRCRKGNLPIQDKWLLRLQQYSGIPAAELLRVACIEHCVYPHPNARRAA